jgi:hypothetical protein
MRLQQDGNPPHFSYEMLQYLNERNCGTLIKRRGIIEWLVVYQCQPRFRIRLVLRTRQIHILAPLIFVTPPQK